MDDKPIRLVNPEPQKDDRFDLALRPRTLADLIGQERVKENVAILIAAARQRGDPLEHVLFYGPPGLGKTTLAHILANEMDVNIKITSGPAIERPGDLAAILTNLRAGDILFIDEIHRLGRAVEEILYPAMEDYALDIIIGKGPSARSLRLRLPRFTVVGAPPRRALRLLRRVRDFAEVRAGGKVSRAVATEALELLDVDELGLDEFDR